MPDRDSHNSRNARRGGSLASTLLVVFVILKLTNVIDWSWLWVLSPLWISAALGLIFFLVIGIILLIATVGLIKEGSAVVDGIKQWFRKEAEE